MTHAEPSLRDYIWVRIPQTPWREIAREVAVQHGVTVDDMLGRRHTRRIAWARHHCWAEIRERRRLSLPTIGRLFGRHHTSILHGIRGHRAREAELGPR